MMMTEKRSIMKKDRLHGVQYLLKKLKEHGKGLYRQLRMVNRIR
jgi:hypothetical protein